MRTFGESTLSRGWVQPTLSRPTTDDGLMSLLCTYQGDRLAWTLALLACAVRRGG